MMRKIGFVLLVVLVAMAATIPPSVRADGPIEGRAGRAEVRYLQGMIDHHQMALDMAADCLRKAESAEGKTLCQNITDAQMAEIKTMRGWLLVWYQIDYNPMPMAHMMEMMAGQHNNGPMMGGMYMGGMQHSGPMMQPDDPPMMMGMMAGLSKLTGRDYEVAWLEAMIDHHASALDMSERLLKQTEKAGHAELRTLAEKIIKDQTAEIEAMEAMLTQMGAS